MYFLISVLCMPDPRLVDDADYFVQALQVSGKWDIKYLWKSEGALWQYEGHGTGQNLFKFIPGAKLYSNVKHIQAFKIPLIHPHDF